MYFIGHYGGAKSKACHPRKGYYGLDALGACHMMCKIKKNWKKCDQSKKMVVLKFDTDIKKIMVCTFWRSTKISESCRRRPAGA